MSELVRIAKSKLGRGEQLTEHEAAALRKEMFPYIERDGHKKFTCDDCPARLNCSYVFDTYNTSGDCLADK